MSTPLQEGFTLVELMIVVLVVGVLAVMAYPALQDNAIRKQVREGLVLAELPKSAVARIYAVTGEMPVDNEQAGVPPADRIVGSFVTAVQVDQGAVTLTFGNGAGKKIEGRKVTLRPAVVPQYRQVPVSWICHQVAVPGNMEVRGQDKTDIPMAWLPVECRGK